MGTTVIKQEAGHVFAERPEGQFCTHEIINHLIISIDDVVRGDGALV